MPPPKKSAKPNGNGGNLGFEEKLWQAADKLRGHMDAAEYKHVVLGLIFLKYISDAFQERFDALTKEPHADPEDRDEYTAEGVFWVPKEARWASLQASAKQPAIGKLIDEGMVAIERDNPTLKGVLTKDYAKLLDRTPGSVAMKLVNFASLDPTHKQRGIRGLKNTSKADQTIWDEFNADWSDLAVQSEKALQVLGGGEAPTDETGVKQEQLAAETERQAVAKIRLGQTFFRSTVLSSYGARCCVCRLPEERLLIASHIVPWSARADLRVNPRNGLCLCALHDRAFDRGLMTVEASLKLRLSRRLEDHLPDEVVEKMFVAYRGKTIQVPEKFKPEAEYLDFHSTTIFEAC
jgi:putative restriction endonuclease